MRRQTQSWRVHGTRSSWFCDGSSFCSDFHGTTFSLPRVLSVRLSSAHLPVSLSGASPLCSSWTCRVGRRLQFVSCSTPLPLLRFLPSSSSSRCSTFAASSLLLVSLPLLIAGGAWALWHLHRWVTACEREVTLLLQSGFLVWKDGTDFHPHQQKESRCDAERTLLQPPRTDRQRQTGRDRETAPSSCVAGGSLSSLNSSLVSSSETSFPAHKLWLQSCIYQMLTHKICTTWPMSLEDCGH